MTWIAYKRDDKFYCKQRGDVSTEIEIDYATFKTVQATGEISDVNRQRRVEPGSGLRSDTGHPKTKKGHLPKSKNEG